MTVNSQTTQFKYDGASNLVLKIKPDGSKTIYVGGVYEVDKTSGGTVTKTTIYYPGGATLAPGASAGMRVNGTLYYVLKDHLGSASVVTDSSGNVVGDQRYYPFGLTRLASGSMYTDKLFTGQREMAGLGIYHFGARFYSPYINRFLSADTVVPNLSNPQDYNRFAYVRNNPVKYIDPSGHAYCDYIDNNNREDCQGGLSRSQSTSVIWGKSKPKIDGGRPPITPPDLECDTVNCDRQTPEDLLRDLAPFTTTEACAYFLDEVTCNPDTWEFLSDPSYLQSVQLSLQNSCLGDFWSCYDPDAIIAGVSVSGSGPSFYRVAGTEGILMFSDLTLGAYAYAGEGTGSGPGGLSGSAYGGLVFNLQDTSAYNGPFGSAGLTVSLLDTGITVFYFWDSTKEPLAPGVTQGLAVGYAPGAQASIWASTTVYTSIP